MIEFGIFIVLIVVGFIFGSLREKNHLADLTKRELILVQLPVRSETRQDFAATNSFLVRGSVVIAADYFKTFVAGIQNFFGGRLATYETLMERARREAIVRMKESAKAGGASEIVGFRVEMVTVAAVGVEILAYGTALKK